MLPLSSQHTPQFRKPGHLKVPGTPQCPTVWNSSHIGSFPKEAGC